MAVTVACRCGKRYAVPDELAGQRIRCKSCGAALQVARPSSPEEPEQRGAAARGRPKSAQRCVSPGRTSKGLHPALRVVLIVGGVAAVLGLAFLVLYLVFPGQLKQLGSGSAARIIVENQTAEGCGVEISFSEIHTSPTDDRNVRVGSQRLRQVSVDIEAGNRQEFSAKGDSARLLSVKVTRGKEQHRSDPDIGLKAGDAYLILIQADGRIASPVKQR